MGKRGSDVPTRSVEESTARMVRSGQALSRGARRDIASGQSIAAKDPKTVTVKPDDYKIKLYKALGVSNKKKSDGGEKYASECNIHDLANFNLNCIFPNAFPYP